MGAVLLPLALATDAVDGRVGAHETEIAPLVIGSTIVDGGALRLVRSANEPVLVTPSFEGGGFVLYTAADPSFESPEADDVEPVPLAAGTKVTVEVVALDETVAVKLRGETLDEAGESVVLGTMPSLHAHPEWQLTLPEGEVSCQSIRLRVHADGGYAASDDYVVRVTNDLAACGALPTPTPTPTSGDPVPTPTPVGGAICGDADGSGTVSVTDGVATLRTAAGLSAGCALPAACDVDGSGTVSVTDGVNVLRAAAGLATSLTCPDL